MSIYGNSILTKEKSILEYKFDMYDFIHNELLETKSLLKSCESDEDKESILEAFDIKILVANIVSKLKEVIKKILIKIENLSTQFANKEYINMWNKLKKEKQEYQSKYIIDALMRQTFQEFSEKNQCHSALLMYLVYTL